MALDCFTEKRHHGRFKLSEKAKGVSTAGGAFHLLDLSEGGFSAKYFHQSLTTGSRCLASIFIPARELYLHHLPVKIQWVHNHSGNGFSSLFSQQAGAKFDELTEEQQEKLQAIIELYAADAAAGVAPGSAGLA